MDRLTANLAMLRTLMATLIASGLVSPTAADDAIKPTTAAPVVTRSAAGGTVSGSSNPGQPVNGQPVNGQPVNGQPVTGQTRPGGKPAAQPGESQPSGGNPPADKPAETVIHRGAIVVEKGDASELDSASLGEDGRVAFQFRNQAWPELIEWLSDLSGQPFDWLELPADRVNITTPGRYTVAEVIDLFNRHLLGRGYTLLALDGGMTVVKCAAINPAIVPRVDPQDLASVPAYSFVRTSLDVGWLSAEKLAEELKPMISENGKLTALTTTNRIEAMDAAITLLQLAELLAREQDVNSRESLAPEFKLRHIPADEAKRLLEEFLGVRKKPDAPMTPEQMQQMQQQMQMRMQQGGKPPAPEAKQPDISVVANSRQNSLLIQAPPDRVAVATEFLKRIDVPGAGITSLADVQSRVEVFRLASLDPEKLIEIVQEMNVLEPSTRIRVDAANRALIVSGSGADRFIIQQIITRLDGSGRKFEVLQLRRLEATDVAESISFLMGKQEKKSDDSRQRYPYYFGGGGGQEKKKEDEFRVAANTRFRQVLLWANDSEMNEVRNLLIKLGELPPPNGAGRNIRVIQADLNPETFQYLKGLERQWQQISPNPLLLPSQEQFESKGPPENKEGKGNVGDGNDVKDEAEKSDEAINPVAASENIDAQPISEALPADDLVSDHRAVLQLTAAQVGQRDSDPARPTQGKIQSADDFDRQFLARPRGEATAEIQATPAERIDAGGTVGDPIRIEIDAAGNLVISSRDTTALDQLENVMLQFTPPRRSYHTFTTQYASATWVKLNLEEFFAEEDAKKDDSNNFSRWYFGFDDSSNKQDDPGGLGRSAKLRFIADIDTGTIVVTNATAEQLKTIEELIQLWDVPEPVNQRRVRYTRLVSVKYGRAAAIAETIKETYRDLLSSNDKAFQQQPGQGGGGGANQVPKGGPSAGRPGGSELVDTGGSGQQGGSADFSFKGKLSLGIDPLGNTLLVSAEGDALLKLVCDMIDQLDAAAKLSDGVRVVNLSASINAESLEMALRTLKSGTEQPAAVQAKPPAAANRRAPTPVVESPDG